MRFAKSLSILIVALILQVTLVRVVSIGEIRPDVVLVALVAVSLRYGSLVGLWSGFLIGIVQDVYAIESLGANALAKTLVGYFIGLFDERVLKISPATKVLFLGVAFACHDLAFTLAAGLRGAELTAFLVHRSLPSGIYTLLVGALVFFFLSGPVRDEA